MHIYIDLTEYKRVHDDRVIGILAKPKIEIPIDGSWSVPALEKVRNHLDEYLNRELPKCIITHGEKNGGEE